MSSRIKKRLEQLELDRRQDAEYHRLMTCQLQEELGLPLPDDVSDEIRDDGLRRIILLQEATRADRNDQQAVESFRRWVQRIHQRYDATNEKP